MYQKFILSVFAVLLVQISPLVAGKKQNKESFPAVEELFSKDQDIDYKGLSHYLHYEFKDKTLLRDALHPMLPAILGSNKDRFDRLEWLGDSVLETAVIEKLLAIFPEARRGIIDQIRENLVKNQTLTDVFYLNLDIEQFLPYPRGQTYEPCNVVEALVGAFKQDDKVNGHLYAEAFIMRMMDSALFDEKIESYAQEKGLALVPQIKDEHKKAIEDICCSKIAASRNPKALLIEVMQACFHQEKPQYEHFLDIDEKGQVFIAVKVSASEIGHKATGKGMSIQEAEIDAAKCSLNLLAGHTLYEERNLETSKNYRGLLNEIKTIYHYPTQSVMIQQSPFVWAIFLDHKSIGQGNGLTKSEAQENAAKAACQFLANKQKQERKHRRSIKEQDLHIKHLERIARSPLEKTLKIQGDEFEKELQAEIETLKSLTMVKPQEPKKQITAKSQPKTVPEELLSLKKAAPVPVVPVEPSASLKKVPVAPKTVPLEPVSLKTVASVPKGDDVQQVKKVKKRSPHNKKPSIPKGSN